MKHIYVALSAIFSFLFLSATAVAQSESGEVLNWLALFEHLPRWLVAITSVVTAATAVTALTPTKSDDNVVNSILRVLNILAGNVGRNKNADDI